MRPPRSSRPPKANVYAVMTHCRLATEMCSECCADGNATVTIEASRTTINCAMTTTARMAHRCGSGAGAASARAALVSAWLIRPPLQPPLVAGIVCSWKEYMGVVALSCPSVQRSDAVSSRSGPPDGRLRAVPEADIHKFQQILGTNRRFQRQSNGYRWHDKDHPIPLPRRDPRTQRQCRAERLCRGERHAGQ